MIDDVSMGSSRYLTYKFPAFLGCTFAQVLLCGAIAFVISLCITIVLCQFVDNSFFFKIGMLPLMLVLGSALVKYLGSLQKHLFPGVVKVRLLLLLSVLTLGAYQPPYIRRHGLWGRQLSVRSKR